MNRSHRSSRSRSLTALWFATPLLALLAMMLIVALMPAEPAARECQPAAAAPGPAPYVSSDPSLPAPGTYTNLAEPQPHVEAF
jgi:hypothetical protein